MIVNDSYSIPISETIIVVSELLIFDRNRSLIYNSPKSGGPATGNAWDGRINGLEAPPGV